MIRGVTLDLGQLVADDAARQALIAEALPAIIQAGYDLKEFDFEKAVADPEGKAIFLPVKVTPKLEESPALVGLLYVREAFQLQGQIVQKGLHPVRFHQLILANVQGSKSPRTPRAAANTLGVLLDSGLGFSCGISVFDGLIDCTINYTIPIDPPLLPGPGVPKPGVCDILTNNFDPLKCLFGGVLDPLGIGP